LPPRSVDLDERTTKYRRELLLDQPGGVPFSLEIKAVRHRARCIRVGREPGGSVIARTAQYSLTPTHQPVPHIPEAAGAFDGFCILHLTDTHLDAVPELGIITAEILDGSRSTRWCIRETFLPLPIVRKSVQSSRSTSSSPVSLSSGYYTGDSPDRSRRGGASPSCVFVAPSKSNLDQIIRVCVISMRRRQRVRRCCWSRPTASAFVLTSPF
jgi:hypothetical protein